MAKEKFVYVCQNCAYQSVKWQGKCPSCGEWNTFVEEKMQFSGQSSAKKSKLTKYEIEPLANFETKQIVRQLLPDVELNRVIGGGLVPGSVLLLGGEPGIGKSTLMLQLGLKYKHGKVLYVSGEESIGQIKHRARRIGITNENCFLVSETQLDRVVHIIEDLNPDLVIIDSVQTLSSENIDSIAGSVSQIRECAARLTAIAKNMNTPVFLIGHITKEGYIAGPKVLEHMVDTVLYFEGDRNYDYRIVRTIKNRFGSVSDIGIYEMNESGLVEVENPSALLLSNRQSDLSGMSICASMEGLRPMMVEIQALVSTTHYGTPQRSTTGFNNRRLSMLLAVLEKRCGLKLGNQDVFLNIAGGLKLDDPSIDLGAAISITSSYFDLSVSSDICFAGEIGLSGEIRPVKQLDKRISEAEKLGFKKIVVSDFSKKNIKPAKRAIEVVAADVLPKLLRNIFKQ